MYSSGEYRIFSVRIQRFLRQKTVFPNKENNHYLPPLPPICHHHVTRINTGIGKVGGRVADKKRFYSRARGTRYVFYYISKSMLNCSFFIQDFSNFAF